MKLENKVAIVTGGATGIGFAVCEAYVKEGAKVCLCGITEEQALLATKNILNKYPQASILPVKVDITKTNEIEAMVAKVMDTWNQIDILVNNAGICQAKSILEMTDEDFESVMNVNATGTFKCTRIIAKIMKNTGGSIINTSSMVGTYGGAFQTAYAASKYAINGITKSCAKELGQYQIRVNAVAPGVIDTDMSKSLVNDEMKNRMNMMTPLRRSALPEELSGIYVYLASNESSFVTGAIIGVDGGLVM